MGEITGVWFDEARYLTPEMVERIVTRPQPHNPPGSGSAKNRARNARRKRQKDREREQ